MACNTATNYVAVQFREYVSYNDASLSMANGVLLKQQQPFTGIVFTMYDRSNDTMQIASYKNGMEDGEWRKYYPGHQLKEQRYFTNGKKTGRYLAYWPSGKKQLEYVFENGDYEGTCKEWNDAGMLTKLMNYKHGYEDGQQQCWYDNGKIKANYYMKDGRRFGLLGTKNCVNVSDSIFN